MSLTKPQAKELLFEAIKTLREELPDEVWNRGSITSVFLNIFDNWDYAEDLYIPDDKLVSRIQEYNKWRKTRVNENPGQLMEEIALLVLQRKVGGG